jgi:pilus assembly protein CpaE
MPADRQSLLAFVADENTRSALARAAQNLQFDDAQIGLGTVADAVGMLSGMATPQRLVIDLSGSHEPLADVEALADVCDDSTQFVALGDVNDINLYKDLMTRGASDYLIKPITASAIAATLQRLDSVTLRPAVAEKDRQLGRIVAVMGARGGAGATTVAVNVAWLMAHELNRRTALVDLDLYFGTCALALDLEPGRGFREALENPERIDRLFIERALVRESEHLLVLAAEDDIATPRTFDPAALALLIDHFQRDFDCIVFDLPRFAARTQVALLPGPLSVVIVSDPTLAGMRDTLRLGKALRGAVAAADFFVVLNRCGAMKGGELDRKIFERDADVTVGHVIPFDVRSAAASAGTGKPMAKVAPRSKAAQCLKRLALDLSGVDAAAKAPGMFKKLLKLSA